MKCNSMKDPVHVDHRVAHVKVAPSLVEALARSHPLKRSRIHALVLARKSLNQEAVIQIVVEVKQHLIAIETEVEVLHRKREDLAHGKKHFNVFNFEFIKL